ncbi:MAG: hypothetical protein COW42_02405 [Deltaproteobacteria bacterium CG17_big_fil_post_rev_8_21_14_2_50_63_7]|nr:MAG: hypothetical protein COW42_02405 [Deltaproteobacteria bacterium CG17_big_fil_post_rev_8_21_14_2_50_63_7]
MSSMLSHLLRASCAQPSGLTRLSAILGCLSVLNVGFLMGSFFGSASVEAQELLRAPSPRVEGEWSLGESGLIPPSDSTKRLRYWVVEGAKTSALRARLSADAGLDFGLLVGFDPQRGSGLAVHFHRGSARLEAVTGPSASDITPLTEFEAMPNLKKADVIEVFAISTGGSLLVWIFDPDSKRGATLMLAADAELSAGFWGAFVPVKRAAKGHVAAMELVDPCVPELPVPIANSKLFVRVDKKTSRVMALDEEPGEEPLNARDARVVNGRLVEEQGSSRVFEVSGQEWRRLHCGQTRVRGVVTETPFKYLEGADLSSDALDGLTYLSPAGTERFLKHYAARYPDLAQLVELGVTHQGRPIQALVLSRGDPAGKPAILLNSAHHGNEPLSVNFTLDAIRTLLENRDAPETSDWLDRFAIWCLPVVNPDGYAAHMEVSQRMGRKNGLDTNGDGQVQREDGVDLNRNYPFRWGETGEEGSRSRPVHAWYRGASPGSEPETQAVMALARSEHFLASISYHIGNIAILAPYTTEDVESPTPNEAWSVAESVAEGMPSWLDKRVYDVRRNLYTVDGTDQDWLRHETGCVALLVEGSPSSPIKLDERRTAVHAVRQSWIGLLRRSIGPGISGRLVNRSGEPVVAVVSIDEIELHAGEQWTSRCRDGRFHRFVPGPGTYTVRIVTGEESVVRSVVVGDHFESVFIIVDAAATSCDGPLWPPATPYQPPNFAAALPAAACFGGAHGAVKRPQPVAALLPPSALDEPTVTSPTESENTCGCAMRRSRPSWPEACWFMLLLLGASRRGLNRRRG